MERRRHRRLNISIPIKFRIQIPESPEVSWVNSGVLRNISGGGFYFVSNDTPPLEPGQVRNFTITPTEEHSDFPGANFINGTSRVVRIDSPKTGDHDIGVALEFISAKFFDFLIKNS
jgi:c-di-GMP-binding flagellar brake protein YcgR